MQFRQDINGLRAIAVIAVVLFHFNPSWLPGGFAGVDVFFVISGFLMTGIIFKGIERKNFSIVKFYLARANRIIPALAVLCIMLLAFGWFYLTPLDYKILGKHVGSSIGFLSNFVYWMESGYFDASSHEKWLLHTWSLSAEWQFYIIYPLVLVTLRQFMSVKTMKILVMVGTVLGFIFCIIATYKWPNSSYYLLPTRAWEMMIGGVAYLYPFTVKEQRKRLIEGLGVALVVGSYFFISKDNYWPGYLAIFPVLGSFLIIQSQRNNSLITNNVVFQKLGEWSYSIYLWHWPIVVAIYVFSLDDIFIYIGLILSVLLGFLSNKYVEKIKFKKDFNRLLEYLKCKPFYMLMCIGSLGVLVFLSEGINSPFRWGANTPQAKFLNKYEQAHSNLYDTYWLKCNTYSSLNDKNTLKTDPSCLSSKGPGGVFLWGDSHSEALSHGIRTLLAPSNVPFYQKTSAGCKASLYKDVSLKGNIKKACEYSNKIALASISTLIPQLVVITQSDAFDKTNWDEIHQKLYAFGVKNILLVGPVPQWKPSLPRVLIKPVNWNNDVLFIHDSGLDMSVILNDTLMKTYSSPGGLEYISLIDNLCRLQNNKYYCRSKLEDGSLLQVDYGHLSIEGSLFVVESILGEKILGIVNRNGREL